MGNLKDKLHIAIRKAVRRAVSCLFLLPMKKNRILMDSLEGRGYTDNPKYISEYLIKHYPGKFEIIWAFRHPEDYADIPGIRAIRYKSPAWLLAYVTSGTVIFNYNAQVYIPKRHGQLVVDTWHAGGAYKRTGLGGPDSVSELSRWRNYEMPTKQISVYLTSSDVFTKYNIKEAYAFKGKIAKFGQPRNDILLNADTRKETGERVRKALGIHPGQFVVLYAPTYRGLQGISHKVDTRIDAASVREAIRRRFGREAVIFVRKHYLDTATDLTGDGVVDVSSYPDMQELLCASDLLITDYSSSIWDFALMERPCLLYVPDLEIYEQEDRGFFTPISKWPGIVCQSSGELEDTIDALDLEQCAKIARDHLALYGACETGKASALSAELIIRYSGRAVF
jgi:CDP-glycerol glycerophosphotransferase